VDKQRRQKNKDLQQAKKRKEKRDDLIGFCFVFLI
jgi:hypothetical protein